jgi:hypothetical protein
MATYYLCPLSTIFQYFNDTGVILAGGKINTYLAGTSTPTTTWTSQTGVTPNANPIILGSNGRLNNVQIWQQAQVPIKIIVTDANNNVLGPTFDNISGIGDFSQAANTYYGGTDTGSANAYILNFSANFTSYTNGIVVYWVPANTNTGASTINMNGLGAIAIQQPNGSSVLSGTIASGQIAIIAIQGGVAVLLSGGTTQQGSWTTTLTGGMTATMGTLKWVRQGSQVTVWTDVNIEGASSSSADFTASGLPAVITPSTQRNVICQNVVSGLNQYCAGVQVQTNNTLLFSLMQAPGGGNLVNVSGGLFSSTNNKGLFGGWTITYSL